MKSDQFWRNFAAVFAAICLVAPSAGIAEMIGLDCTIDAANGPFQAEFIVDMDNEVADYTATGRDGEVMSETGLEVVVAPRDITISLRSERTGSVRSVWTISREDLSAERKFGRRATHSGACEQFEPNIENAF